MTSTRAYPAATLEADSAGLDPWEVDLGALSDPGVAAALAALQQVMARLEAVTARVIGEAERRGIPAARGFASTTSWLIATTGNPPGVCRSQVRTSRRLRQMPATRQAFAQGELPGCRVRLLVEAAETAPETFTRDEEMLVEHARTLDACSFPRAVAHWRRLADQERFEWDAERQHDRRSLCVSATWGGMVRVDGNLDPEGGSVLLAALRSLTDPAQLDPVDRRSPAQRRADALVEICRRHLDRGGSAPVGGERPHVTVTVDLETLEGRAGERCDLDSTGAITAQAARRLACDAQVTRVITKGASQPLDVGRATRTIPVGLRRALLVRDGGCTHDSCTIPAAWCDAHHVRHWADGGPTRLDNLRLLCRRHHRTAHHHHPYPQRR